MTQAISLMNGRTTRASLLLIVAVAALSPGTSGAQQLTPTGWSWRTDRPATPRRGEGSGSDSTFEFSPMAPGWHVTMGPGGVLHAPGERLEGRFILEGELILFPDASENEYGVFIGGAGLDGEAARWTAFVVRADGQAAVIRSEGGATSMLMPWAAHAGVKARVAGASAKNIVTVRAEPDSVRFLVNGTRIAAWPASAFATDGAYGFRIGRAVNLHITNLDATRRLAPFPRR